MGGFLMGAPFRMVFMVVFYVPWCRYLSGQRGVAPQLYADNLKCATTDDGALWLAVHVTDQCIRAVGQEASPALCVLLSTSKAMRKRMKYWSISAGESWAVKLDVRDLGGHLDVTRRARAGTLATRASKAISQVPLVGALPFGFFSQLVLSDPSFCLLGYTVLKVLLPLVRAWMPFVPVLYELVCPACVQPSCSPGCPAKM